MAGLMDPDHEEHVTNNAVDAQSNGYGYADATELEMLASDALGEGIAMASAKAGNNLAGPSLGTAAHSHSPRRPRVPASPSESARTRARGGVGLHTPQAMSPAP